jgi:hypothetical protein
MVTTDWIDLLFFLVTHSKKKKGHRIRSLHQSFSTFDFGPAAKGYSNSSIEEEFPRSADGNLTFNHTLRDLTLDCIDASTKLA